MAKSGIDKALMFLTVVSVGVLCMQPVLGMSASICLLLSMIYLSGAGVMSINVTIPANGLTRGHPYNAFGIVLALVFLDMVAYLMLARYWWVRGKRRRDLPL